MAIVPLSEKDFDAVLFDLDGVLTDSAALHARSWKQLFDSYLHQREGSHYSPFDMDSDYRSYVDGKPRYDGIKSFLASRGMTLPEGQPDDPPTAPTLCGLGNWKNAIFLEALGRDGITTFPPAIEFLERVREAGFKTALVSSSRNSRTIVKKVGLSDKFDVWVDGNDVLNNVLRGKPEPDMFLTAAAALDVEPGRAVVIEDAIAGVQAGLRGKFGLVIGVDRTHHPEALAEAGAHLVVSRLSDVPVAGRNTQPIEALPSALDAIDGALNHAVFEQLAIFLDYDGTLTPIVDRPELALLSNRMRRTLKHLAELVTVAIISGRDLTDLRRLVALDELYYAGSHGFEIAGPDTLAQPEVHGAEYLPVLDWAERELRAKLADIRGSLVEHKRFSVAVHYRLVDKAGRQAVKAIVDEVVEAHPELRRTLGKKVYDLQPDIDWHKGKAVYSLLALLDLDRKDVLPIYIGDDLTDEDAFRELRGWGIGIVIKGASRSTSATLALADTDQVADFLDRMIERLHRDRPDKGEPS